MAFLALLIGVVLIVSVIRNTQGQLLAALQQDVPAFAIWGAAIFGLSLIGYIPGLKPVSRGLLALVLIVIVLTNYRQILAAFTGAAFNAPAQAGGSQPTLGDGTFGGSPLDMLAKMGQQGGFDFSDLLGTDTSGGSQAVNG
jgi:hypothetical protein